MTMALACSHAPTDLAAVPMQDELVMNRVSGYFNKKIDVIDWDDEVSASCDSPVMMYLNCL